jgi:hypothetical protein
MKDFVENESPGQRNLSSTFVTIDKLHDNRSILAALTRIPGKYIRETVDQTSWIP